MANLVAFADGNFSGASTFRSVDTTLSVTTFNLTNGQNSATTLALSPQLTSTTTNTIEGILIYLKANTGSSGTITVGISNNNTSNNLASVTVNWSDLPLVPTVVFFKFGSTVALVNGTNYEVGIQTSVTSSCTIYKASSTANDWFRLWRTNSSASAAAADVTWMAGDWTAASTFATRTITMDVTTATTTNFGQFIVGSKGVFAWGVTGNTNYRLRIASGVACAVLGHGTLTMGTSATPVPAYTNAILDFESAGAASSGLEVRGGTLTTYGSQLKQAWVTNKALTTNVATLTTATSHGFVTGELVTISISDATFDGSFTIASTPSTTTFTYAKTASNVGSTAASGTASIQATVSNKQLTSNIATITTSAVHGFVAGEYVTVTGVDTALNGTFQILSVPTTTTFCYGVTTIYQQNITNKALTTNVATLTTATYHNFQPGDPIVVNIADSIFNGNFTITAVPTSTTFTFGVTHADVVSASTTGTTTCVPNIPIVSKSLTSNVATLTTRTPHGFGSGESVVVAGVDATFNGTFTISAIPTTGVYVSPVQFSYAVTASNISATTTYNNLGTVGPSNINSQSASGTATICKAPTYVLLAADRSAGAAAITTDRTTNWIAGTTVSTGHNLLANGDTISVASTTRTSSETERFKAISTISGTSITVNANFANFHSGTINTNEDTRAEIINVTRNVKISGAVANTITTASSTTGYVFCDESSTVSCYYTEFVWMGGGSTGTTGSLPATADKTAGLDFRCSPTAGALVGSAIVGNCSFHDGSSNCYGIYVNVASVTGTTVDSILIQNCVGDNINNSFFIEDNTNATGTNIVIDNCVQMRCGNSNTNHGLCASSDLGIIITNSISACGNTGIGITETANAAAYNATGWISNVICHGSDSIGISFTGTENQNINLTNVRVWRSNGNGINFANAIDCFYENIQCFGNNTTGMSFAPSVQCSNVTIKNIYMDLGVTQNSAVGVQATGINFGGGAPFINFYIINGQFGANQGHTTADFGTVVNSLGLIVLCNNVSLQSSTPISNFTLATTNITSGNKFGFTRYNQQSGNHRTVYLYGTITSDTSIFKTASPSERLTPTACTLAYRLKMESSPKRAALANGNNTTVGVWVRQSVVGDGATYNGQFPQLILKANPGAGIFTDQLIATGTTSGQGSFEQLTGTTPTVTDDSVLEFVVQCNGTVGWVNVDDWTVT